MTKLTLFIATPSGKLMRAEVPVSECEPKAHIEDTDIIMLGKHAQDFLLSPYDSKMDIAELTADMNEDEIIAFLKGRLRESQRENSGHLDLLSMSYMNNTQLEADLANKKSELCDAKAKIADLERQLDNSEQLNAYLDTRLRESEARVKKGYMTKPKGNGVVVKDKE